MTDERTPAADAVTGAAADAVPGAPVAFGGQRPRHAYVHVPFCARRCSYCDFAIAVRKDVPVAEYLGALETELSMRFATAGRDDDWELDTLYFGGGTPSRLGAGGLADAVELMTSVARLAPGAEVTVEVNPEDILPGFVSTIVAAGVNRLSIGAQSFDDRALEWMHRVHAASRVGEAVELARAEGIDNISLDLIFALPTALDRSWERDVEAALALQPRHLSLYGLTVEPATPLGRWAARGLAEEAPEERYEAEFLRANALLTAAGFEHYEVSNFARPGARSRHNSSYWQGVSYAGLGPSAHEFDGHTRRWNVAAYVVWLRRLRERASPMAGSELLTEANRTAESVYLGLRTVDGLVLRPGEEALVAPWVDAGWGTVDGGRLGLTPLGWLRLDALAASLTMWRSR
ncbi:MAG: radical SAM family heme chaperone HemW [Gemmatimonadaceae bacterium]